MRKQLDPRITLLLERAVVAGHRSFFVIIGDHGKDQIVNLHFLLSKANLAAPNILWCYKKDLGFSSHKQKRAQQLKKRKRVGNFQTNEEDPFELFVNNTNIRYCYYKDTEKILGKTFEMCILQDFEALTPNLLCRTVETVRGGGMVVLLLRSAATLKDFYTTVMDSHKKFTSSIFGSVKPRFNERMILSFTKCDNCLILDDELNPLPVTTRTLNSLVLNTDAGKTHLTTTEVEKTRVNQPLKEFRSTLPTGTPLASIARICVTLDQARCVDAVASLISDSGFSSTTAAITAGRGRGKSAALGLCVALSIAQGCTNVFVTAPSPDNTSTLFEFAQIGLKELGFVEHRDYTLVSSRTNESRPEVLKIFGETKKMSLPVIVRMNVHKDGKKQTVQFIYPTECLIAQQADVLVIDEAAAIPLVHVRKLLSDCLVIMASTISGYEGTGRALSIKLIGELERKAKKKANASNRPVESILRNITMEEPIRYKSNDPIEQWLRNLVCLDATKPAELDEEAVPPLADTCRLYRVNRDSLFSYMDASEALLHRIMSLFVSSHYKNSPNDLLMLAEAPNHEIYILCPPFARDSRTLPDIYVACQVSVEGRLTAEAVAQSMRSGTKPAGDLLAWTLTDNFVNEDFAALTGARIVRIAAHPALFRRGYGTQAVQQLIQFLSKPCDDTPTVQEVNDAAIDGNEIKVRSNLPRLLEPCDSHRPCYQAHYMGTSFGLTKDLFKFWNRLGFMPVYLSQRPNDVTGESSMITLRQLRGIKRSIEVDESAQWLNAFVADFGSRFVNLCAGPFSTMATHLATDVILATQTAFTTNQLYPKLTAEGLQHLITDQQLQRLEQYTSGLKYLHLAQDVIPTVAQLYFTGRIVALEPSGGDESATNGRNEQPIHLSWLQAALLVGIGAQRKSLDELESEFQSIEQRMGLFQRTLSKLVSNIRRIEEIPVEQTQAMAAEQASKALDEVRAPNSQHEEKENTKTDSVEDSQKSSVVVGLVNQDRFLRKYAFKNVADDVFEKLGERALEHGGQLKLPKEITSVNTPSPTIKKRKHHHHEKHGCKKVKKLAGKK